MSPTIEVGDIVIVKETTEIEKGDIIAFKIDGAIVTHRVQEVIENESEKTYKTKGDANKTEDREEVKEQEIEGKYCFKIPKIGKLVMLFQGNKALLIIMAIQSILIVCIIRGNVEISEEEVQLEKAKTKKAKPEKARKNKKGKHFKT